MDVQNGQAICLGSHSVGRGTPGFEHRQPQDPHAHHQALLLLEKSLCLHVTVGAGRTGARRRLEQTQQVPKASLGQHFFPIRRLLPLALCPVPGSFRWDLHPQQPPGGIRQALPKEPATQRTPSSELSCKIRNRFFPGLFSLCFSLKHMLFSLEIPILILLSCSVNIRR